MVKVLKCISVEVYGVAWDQVKAHHAVLPVVQLQLHLLCIGSLGCVQDLGSAFTAPILQLASHIFHLNLS
jgi:hypothetical protein